jgi:serine/threonine protein kinase
MNGKEMKAELMSVGLRFHNERNLQGKMDHPNVLRLYSHTTMWIPKQIGLLFVEKTNFTLRERLQRARTGELITNRTDLIKQLLSGLDHIHTRTNPICHLQLSLDNTFVKDNSDGTCDIKIGNFSKAQFVTPTDEVEDVTSALIDLDDPVGPDMDMEASADIIFSILTSEETKENDSDLEKIPEVEFRVLILALKNGFSGSDALQSPAFHLAGEKG